jgi:hypothetical protein
MFSTKTKTASANPAIAQNGLLTAVSPRLRLIAVNVCGFASVAAADADQNKTTTFLWKMKLQSPDYFP